MQNAPTQSSRLREVAGLFLKLGITAFGGPAAHIAMMHEEVVVRRKWLSDEEFLDLLGATNLIPGPNSTEMAIHLSFLRAGLPGLIVGGASFILPAMLIVGVLAWAYVQFGALPQAELILYGVKPVAVGIIAGALLNLGKKAVKGPLTAVVGALVVALSFLGLNEIALLLLGGVIVMLAKNITRLRGGSIKSFWLPLIGLGAAASAAATFSLPRLFFAFLKIGSVLYGSGYVLLAFLRTDLVINYGWLTNQQLIDAVAIGQITPGPVFTTATFIGYLLGGVPGSLLATLGIFLPSFIFVALSNPIIPKIRQSAWVSGLLDGVNVAALGLMVVVTWALGQAALIDPLAIAIAVASFVLLVRYRVNSTWLIVGGALLGLARLLF